MMAHDSNNKRTTVRFGGPEDNSIRSAWKSTNRSILPPSPVKRKATIGPEALEEVLADAALVASLDTGSTHEPTKNSHKVLGPTKPSSLKSRSKTVPILKKRPKETTIPEKEKNENTDNPPLMASRSAWKNNETRHSFRSICGPPPALRQATLEESDLQKHIASRSAWGNDETRHSFRSLRGPCPVQRQATLEESDLQEVCASVAAMGFVRDLSSRELSATRSFRGSSSIEELVPEDTHEGTTERGD